MNILLIYPEYPITFWSFKYALKFISKKAGYPPLGLLTIASLLPADWNKRLLDLNVRPLKDNDLRWADYVFISAMSIQESSLREVLTRCQALGVKTVGGGPLFTSEPERFPEASHLVLGEAEQILPEFIEDLQSGHARRIYRAEGYADMQRTPVPAWNLIRMKDYASMNLQYSRGCPFNCEFCDIVSLYGRVPRTKSKEQVLAELDALLKTGWQGGVFFVDDNFIGNQKKLKEDILPAITEWMNARSYPFSFSTEASINLADDPDLMQAMTDAGFCSVFLGIETPNENSLAECNKVQNKNRNLVASIKVIQQAGMQVQGGFIVGFDNDGPNIFEQLIQFIQESGIIVAMVGLLNAPKGTRLYQRMVRENRILKHISGDNTDFSMNFIPKMNYPDLVEGYRKIISAIYSPELYYKRVMDFIREYKPPRKRAYAFEFGYLAAFFKSIVLLGALGKERAYYWKLFFWSLLRRPKLFPMAITFAIYGFHFRKVFER